MPYAVSTRPSCGGMSDSSINAGLSNFDDVLRLFLDIRSHFFSDTVPGANFQDWAHNERFNFCQKGARDLAFFYGGSKVYPREYPPRGTWTVSAMGVGRGSKRELFSVKFISIPRSFNIVHFFSWVNMA